MKNVIHQIDSENELLLLSASYTAKLGLGFRNFVLKPTERAQLLLKNGTRDFQNSPPFQISACFFFM